jgi:transcriptional regulator GlxA family with amidase domain
MYSRLDAIKNWPELAKRENFRTDGLAKACQVTQRQLERYIRFRFRTTARAWMTRHRLATARQLLLAGCTVKEAGAKVAYTSASHFSRAFRRVYGEPQPLPLWPPLNPKCRIWV